MHNENEVKPSGSSQRRSPELDLNSTRPQTNLSKISDWQDYKKLVKEKNKNAEDALTHFKLNSWFKKYK